jgi:hypothetical protein
MYANSNSNVQTSAGSTSAQGRRAEPVGSSSWYAKMATGWGAALDRQADKTVALSEEMASGLDNPGAALQISAAAHQLSFLSTAAATTSNSIAQALETLGKKQ